MLTEGVGISQKGWAVSQKGWAVSQKGWAVSQKVWSVSCELHPLASMQYLPASAGSQCLFGAQASWLFTSDHLDGNKEISVYSFPSRMHVCNTSISVVTQLQCLMTLPVINNNNYCISESSPTCTYFLLCCNWYQLCYGEEIDLLECIEYSILFSACTPTCAGNSKHSTISNLQESMFCSRY